MTHSSRRGEDVSLALKHLSRDESLQVTQNAVIPSRRFGAGARAPVKRAPVTVNDPLFSKQWFLAPAEDDPDTTLNVMPVWESGLTGKGIVTAIIDGGVFFIHKDLEDNYVCIEFLTPLLLTTLIGIRVLLGFRQRR